MTTDQIGSHRLGFARGLILGDLALKLAKLLL